MQRAKPDKKKKNAAREHVNTGVITLGSGHASEARSDGATLIVSGLSRSGTSMVANLLQSASIYMGSAVDDVVYEDNDIAKLLDANDLAGLRQLVAERNKQQRLWGFKRPQLHRRLAPADIALFRNPRLIFTFRDPVAIAQRNVISEHFDGARAFADAVAEIAALAEFIKALAEPVLLISYEKALADPNRLVDDLAAFCSVDLSAKQREKMVATVAASPDAYLANAVRKYRGALDGLHGTVLFGWCQEVPSPVPVTLSVAIDGKNITHTTADCFRADLRDAGIGDGRHAFTLDLKDALISDTSTIDVLVSGRTFALPNSGLTAAELRRRIHPEAATEAPAGPLRT